jgi:hypothetical protein
MRERWSVYFYRRIVDLRAALFLIAAAFALNACATGGIAEFEAYKAAFDKAQTTSASIFDQLAIQERWLFLRVNRKALNSVTFDPNLARYYTDSIDPPGTAALRASLDTIKTYNDILYGLETGQTAEALAGKISALESSLISGVKDTSSVISGLTKAEPHVAAALPAIDAAFQVLLPFVQEALKLRSREYFRTFLVKAYPTVMALLHELRESTRYIFPVLTAAIRNSDTAVRAGLTAADTDKVNTYRKLLADWVILIDATAKALERAKLAAEAPPTVVSTITGLTAVAIEMDAVAQSAKKHLAELATK